MLAFEWIAGLMILAGIYYYGKKRLLGPGLSIIGCFIWLVLGIMHDMWSLAALNAILLFTNSFNLAMWWNGSEHIVLNGEREGEVNGKFKKRAF